MQSMTLLEFSKAMTLYRAEISIPSCVKAVAESDNSFCLQPSLAQHLATMALIWLVMASWVMVFSQ